MHIGCKMLKLQHLFIWNWLTMTLHLINFWQCTKTNLKKDLTSPYERKKSDLGEIKMGQNKIRNLGTHRKSWGLLLKFGKPGVYLGMLVEIWVNLRFLGVIKIAQIFWGAPGLHGAPQGFTRRHGASETPGLREGGEWSQINFDICSSANLTSREAQGSLLASWDDM